MMGLAEILFRTQRHHTGRIDAAMTRVVMGFNVLKIQRVCDPFDLIQIAHRVGQGGRSK